MIITNYEGANQFNNNHSVSQRNRAVSEVASLASRHRRRSAVPSFPGFGGRGWRAGSVDQNLLEGFQSDGGKAPGAGRPGGVQFGRGCRTVGLNAAGGLGGLGLTWLGV